MLLGAQVNQVQLSNSQAAALTRAARQSAVANARDAAETYMEVCACVFSSVDSSCTKMRAWKSEDWHAGGRMDRLHAFDCTPKVCCCHSSS